MISFATKSIATLRGRDEEYLVRQHRGAPSPRRRHLLLQSIQSIAALRVRAEDENALQEHRGAPSPRRGLDIVQSIVALQGHDTCMMSSDSIAALEVRDHSPSGTRASRRSEFAPGVPSALSGTCDGGAP